MYIYILLTRRVTGQQGFYILYFIFVRPGGRNRLTPKSLYKHMTRWVNYKKKPPLNILLSKAVVF